MYCRQLLPFVSAKKVVNKTVVDKTFVDNYFPGQCLDPLLFGG
jgi:hypothetical protein